MTIDSPARANSGHWEQCEDDGCGWDFQWSSPGHVERTFWSVLALARAMRCDIEDPAWMALSGRWYHAWSGTSALNGESVACDEDGEAQLQWDDDGNPIPCTDVVPWTWVTMNPDKERPGRGYRWSFGEKGAVRE